LVVADPVSEWGNIYKVGEHAMFIGDYRTAEQAYGSALELLRRSGDHSARLKFTLEKLTQAYLLDNNLKAAESFYIRLEPLLHTGDHSSRLEQTFSIDLKELANSYERKWNRYHDQNCLEHSIELLQSAYGDNAAKSYEQLVTLSQIYIDYGRVDHGVEQLKRAISIAERKCGTSPTALTDALNQAAINCKNKQQYEQAAQLEQRALKLVKANPAALGACSPAFYCLLGMSALAQKRVSDSDAMFRAAKAACSRVKSLSQRQTARRYLGLLTSVPQSDSDRKQFSLAEAELHRLITVNDCLPKDSFGLAMEQGWLDSLSSIADKTGKHQEAKYLLGKAIELMKMCDTKCQNGAPDLYLRLAIYQASDLQLKKASESFGAALKSEQDQKSFHAALVLFWWGYFLRDSDRSLATEKLTKSVQIAGQLAPAKRGTILSDAVMVQSYIEGVSGRKEEQQRLIQKSTEEILMQRKLGSKLGPDFYHRM
jgi:hypothetical protein